MPALDVIALPGQPGMFARRVAVEAWQAAGSPHVNSAGRLYAEQKRLWDGWRQRLPGFNPADNPDDETEALAHCRFVAFDIDPTTDRIKRLAAAGLHRPYTYEPWHWELPNVHSYALVRSIPATASLDITPITQQEEDPDMSRIIHHPNGSMALAGSDGTFVPLTTMDEVAALIGTGAVPKDYVNLSDGLMWNLRTAIAARKAAQGSTDPQAVAAALAPLIVPAVVTAVGGGLTQEQVEQATEAAVRAVFADAATK